MEKREVLAVSELVPQWVLDIQSSYEGDEWIASLKTKLKEEGDNPSEHNHLTQYMQLIRYKNRICVGSAGIGDM